MSTHLHLAPIARLIAWRGASVANVLCGIEAWVPLRAAERWALASGELIAISHHTERRFKAANPEFAAAHVSVVHPGLPPSFGSPAVAPNPRPMALIVGRMAKEEAYKGHDLLIDIWPHVLSRHPNAELCMVGDGTDRLRLEDKAAQAGLIGPVTFTGRVDDRTLDRLYRQCTFFVMPSRDEGFGLVFVEAMRAGKACIGGHGAAAEIIQHGTTGFVVDPRNGDDVAAAVLRLLDEPGTCRAMGAAGRARYLSTFTDEQFQHRLMRAVNQEAA
jgi:phosphatidylinositol alpha-1,6-mannosyltransferase